MDNVLDNAKAHFKRQLENPMRSIEVPEWGNGTPAKIYFHEVMTMREKTAIGNLSANGKSDEAVAMTLILRARDENGTVMFNKNSSFDLRTNVAGDVLERIAMEMIQATVDLSDLDIEKN